jgi:protein TonB
MPASSGPPDPEPEVIPELPEATQVSAEMPPEKKQPPPSDTPAPDEEPPEAATVPVPAAEAGQLRPSGPETRVNPAPPYPRPAILRGLHGSVWIEVHLDARGHPVASRLLQSSGHALLDRSALRTVQSQWRFAAPGKEGPTSNAVVQITFALP